jgi:hypothetical protein
VLRPPKGRTGPAQVDGLPVEGNVALAPSPAVRRRDNPDHLRQLEAWLRSYRPEELFDEHGSPARRMPACATTTGSASTAPTCPKSPTGPGTADRCQRAPDAGTFVPLPGALQPLRRVSTTRDIEAATRDGNTSRSLVSQQPARGRCFDRVPRRQTGRWGRSGRSALALRPGIAQDLR